MFLRFTCIGLILCAFSPITHSLPFIFTSENNPNSAVESSPLSELLRYKARIFDELSNGVLQTFQRGVDVFSRNIGDLGNSFNSLLRATNRLIDNGFAAGRQYGTTLFQGAMIVPKTIADFVSASVQNNTSINANDAKSLSYVTGKPNYLFQFNDGTGRVIPVTEALANKPASDLNV